MTKYASARFWDKTAEKYAAMPVRNADAYEATLNKVRTHLSKTDDVLELGCGTGSTAIALAPDVASIVATDVSLAMLDKGKEKAAGANISNVTFVQSDTADAPAGPFDMVLAFNLLHLIEDMEAALGDIAARTKPGGLFVSKTFCMPERRNVIWFFIKTALPVLQMIGKAPFFAKLSKDDLLSAITRAGFDIIEIERAPGKDPRLTVIARRAA